MIKKIFLFSTLLFATNAFCAAVKVAPLNWWVGMQAPELQLMVHAPQVKGDDWQLQPYAGVSLQSVQFADSDNYAFLNLQVSAEAQSGWLNLINRSDPSQSFQFELKARQAGSKDRRGFSSRDVVYLITPDRFANGDPKNDNHPSMVERSNPEFKGGRHGGDLAGVIARLDYLQQLGVTQLWLTPVLENSMPSYSYHGYAITDLYQVDPRMGSNEQYIELAQQAKARGIGLIMDMVPNHIGSEHPWLKDKPTADWINYGGEFVGTSHARQTVQDPHASEYDKQRFTDGWFVPTMPDLNQKQPLLARYLTQNAIWWIETAALSGFRVDTYPYSDKMFLQQWLQAIFNEYPHFNVVGEEWTTETAIAAYWQRGGHNRDGYISYLPTVMDFSLQTALVQALNEPEGWDKGWWRVYQSIAKDFLYADPNNVLIFGDNHDMSRVYTQLKQNLPNTKLALTLLLTMRGIPQLYYGTEVLLDNGASNDHGDIRIDFPGGFSGGIADAVSGQGLSRAQQEMQAYVRQLLHIRAKHRALQTGKLTHFAPFDGIYGYARVDEQGGGVLVLLNKQPTPYTFASTRMAEVLGSKSTGRDLLMDKDIALATLTVPAQGALLVLF
ncbi:glycoside hydrolase family 13 protein [Pseudoalteromonas fenneropenaei]|uniref:Glycoside hydrolase family 13 protein n=1 Tax=Pseudoalteromonas fenneropenaei TaxID=1737459 RepID=A0ABV7CN76_9GAMM